MKSKIPVSKDKLIFREVYIGGVSKEELLKKLEDSKIGLNEFALKIINHKEFTTSSDRKKYKL